MKTNSWFGHRFEPKLALAVQADGDQAQSRNLNALLASGEPKRTVRAGRRRPSGPSTEPREQAAAPKRERPDQPQPGGGASGGYRPPASQSTGGGLPGGRMSPLMLIVGGLFLCVVVAFMVLGGGGDDGGDNAPSVFEQPAQPAQPAQPQQPAARPTPLPTRPANLTGGSQTTPGQTWTVMLYMNADDKVLEQDIYVDLNEAELVGSSDRVNIVAQMDRFRGGFRGDGDWTDTRRYFVTRDNSLDRLGSRLVQNLGEVNMASPDSLIDFATWAMEAYPADKYVLIMSDHGMGWPGGWTDPEPRSGVRSKDVYKRQCPG